MTSDVPGERPRSPREMPEPPPRSGGAAPEPPPASTRDETQVPPGPDDATPEDPPRPAGGTPEEPPRPNGGTPEEPLRPAGGTPEEPPRPAGEVTQGPPRTPYEPAPPSPSAVSTRRSWALLAHISAFAMFFGVPSFVGPLVVWLLQRDQDPFVAHHAREALNFNLSILVYMVAAVVVLLATFGIGVVVVLPAFVVGFPFWLIVTILAAVKASNEETYRYPLTIRFV